MMTGNLDDVSICTSTTKSVPRNLSWIGNYKLISCIAWKLSPDQFYLFHRNPSCYNNFLILNFIMLSAQYVVALYWQYFSVLFRCYVAPLLFSCPLFRVISIVLPVFRLYVPPVFRCSAGVPCSGVPGFKVCLKDSIPQGQVSVITVIEGD